MKTSGVSAWFQLGTWFQEATGLSITGTKWHRGWSRSSEATLWSHQGWGTFVRWLVHRDLCVQPLAPEAFRQWRRITAETVVQQDLCRTLPGGASSHSPTTTPPALGSASNKGKKARLMELVKRAKWAETSPQVLTLDGQRWGAGTVSSLKSTL